MNSSTVPADNPSQPLHPATLVWSVVYFALLAVIVRRFDLESSALQDLMVWALGGFVVSALLPLRYRQGFFVALSITGLLWVAGVSTGLWVLAIGISLILLCHLPIPFVLRLVLLLGAGAVLALQRITVLPSPWSRPAWAILASMFMFRLIVYLYDIRHNVTDVRPMRTLAYFFPLPNVCFPLFPVLDYHRFSNHYFDQDPPTLYRQGLHWMGRGVLHLLLYQVVYYYFTLAPHEVTNAATLVRYLVVGVLLYLRVGGQFHLIVGLLKMFGFNLPETNNLYFFATNFNDYWRRINIYWKDFMVKVFYLPIYMTLSRRGMGRTATLCVATVVVFAITWFLHAYQWFWLQGDFPIRGTDALFWGAMGVVVLANSLTEAKTKGRKRLGPVAWTPRRTVEFFLKALMTFTTVAILWSLWSAESLRSWSRLWTVTSGWTLLLAVVVPYLVLRFLRRMPNSKGSVDLSYLLKAVPGKPESWTAGLLAVVALLTVPSLAAPLGPRFASKVADLRSSRLNATDRALLEHSYYETLQHSSRFESQLWQRFAAAEPAVAAHDSDLFRRRTDFLWHEIQPNTTGLYKGKRFSSNQWGMRDQEYSLAKPPETFRIAVMGASHVMGHGVGDNEVFAHLLEEDLNREDFGDNTSYQVLNHAIDDYSPLQQLVLLRESVLGFEPDLVLYIAHSDENFWARKHLARTLVSGVEIPDAFLDELAQTAAPQDRVPDGLTKDERISRAVLQLQGVPANQAVAHSYNQFAQAAIEAGARPVWVYLPKLWEHTSWRNLPRLKRNAQAAGFQIISLDGVYPYDQRAELRVSPADEHPNAIGHRLVAERLFQELQEQPQLLLLQNP